MVGYVDSIEQKTLANEYFRQVLFTGKFCQLVVMCLQPNEDIGMEVHPTVDQFFRIEKGQGKVIMNGEESVFGDGSAIIVPAGTQHNVINTSATEVLKLYTIYSPPNHPPDRLNKTKADALAAEGEHA